MQSIIEDVYVKFDDVYTNQFAEMLYALLGERTKNQSISHEEMPSFDEHIAFIESRPYLYWYRIRNENSCVGAIYLTEKREIGIGIFKDFQGQGYAGAAINQLMGLHPGKFLANINPENEWSIHLFQKLDFKHIQNTYVKS